MSGQPTTGTLARRALRITQAAGAPLFMFSLTAGEILQVTDIPGVEGTIRASSSGLNEAVKANEGHATMARPTRVGSAAATLAPIFTKRIGPQSGSRTGSGGSGLPTRGR
jgi:hypothetical protein